MLFLVAAYSILAASHSTPAAQGVLLRYKFHAGQSHSYDFTMTMNMLTHYGEQSIPMNIKMTSTMKQTVKSVAPDGTATLSTVQQNQHMTNNGKDFPMGKSASGKTTTMKITPTGHVSGLSLGSANPMGMGLDSLQVGNVLPDKPVSVGSHWTGSVSFGKADIQLQNTLVSLQKSGGHTLATIRSSGDIDLSKMSSLMGGIASGASLSGRMVMNVRTVFDSTTGIMRSMDSSGKMSMHMTMSGQGKTGMNIQTSGTQGMTVKLIH